MPQLFYWLYLVVFYTIHNTTVISAVIILHAVFLHRLFILQQVQRIV